MSFDAFIIFEDLMVFTLVINVKRYLAEFQVGIRFPCVFKCSSSQAKERHDPSQTIRTKISLRFFLSVVTSIFKFLLSLPPLSNVFTPLHTFVVHPVRFIARDLGIHSKSLHDSSYVVIKPPLKFTPIAFPLLKLAKKIDKYFLGFLLSAIRKIGPDHLILYLAIIDLVADFFFMRVRLSH